MALQYLGCFFEVGGLSCGYQPFGGHYLIDRAAEVTLKAQVAVGHNADEHAGLVHYRDTSDMIFFHHLECIADCRTAADGNRIIYHAVLGTFYSMYLTGLFLDSHILMDNAKTAFACDCDGKLSLGNGIHRG